MARHTETIELSEPVTAHGELVHALEFREPLGRDLVAAGSPDEAWELRLLASCCSVPPSTLMDMKIVDVRKIRRAARPFLGAPEVTGPSSTGISSAPTHGTTSGTSSD